MRNIISTAACIAAAIVLAGCDEKQKPNPGPLPGPQPGPAPGPATGLPKGAVILMLNNCPQGFTDLTGRLNGRLIAVDTNAVDEPVLVEGDGSHPHGGGGHQHSVSGSVNEPGEGFREGGGGRRSAGIRSPIVGTAQAIEHSHDGGAHQHASVGVRLCQAG
jgi:hypothetical protein